MTVILEHKDESRKSLVTVRLDSGKKLSCYNDQYCIGLGDWVFAESDSGPVRGYVTEVNHHFKIKKSACKKILSVADTEVHGQFYNARSHFVTFDPEALPLCKIRTWYIAPQADDEEFEVCWDGESFALSSLSGMKIQPHIAERGVEYYSQNKVIYLSLDKTSGKGYAIVRGNRFYEVDFRYEDGRVSENFCSCPCGFTCKHQFAVMLQLDETLKIVQENYNDLFEETGCFAAITKGELFTMAVDRPVKGGFVV